MKKIIDISEHNGTIDFDKVKQDGIYGVIIRIGWIGNKKNHTLDKKFKEYYKKAKEAKLKIGFYVYSYCKSIETLRDGTNWLISYIEDKKFDLPVFLDLEDKTIADCGKENLTNQAVQFCKIIENMGFKSGVYASKDWFINKLRIKELLNFKIWLAEWNGKENHTLGYKVDLWQYSSNGKVSGINSRVDMNKCLCDCIEENEKNKIEENKKEIKKEDFVEVKIYQNGSTYENVFSDTDLSIKIGRLGKQERCECLGICEGRAIVRYKVDNKNNYKIGFVKWLGGIKNPTI